MIEKYSTESEIRKLLEKYGFFEIENDGFDGKKPLIMFDGEFGFGFVFNEKGELEFVHYDRVCINSDGINVYCDGGRVVELLVGDFKVSEIYLGYRDEERN